MGYSKLLTTKITRTVHQVKFAHHTAKDIVDYLSHVPDNARVIDIDIDDNDWVTITFTEEQADDD